MSKGKILSLFDYSGNWSRPWREDGYDVIQVDLKHGIDIMTFEPPDNVYGVLAAPPCTDFSGSGARWWAAKDADGRTDVSLDLVHRAMWIISCCKPAFWMLENPVGRLSRLYPRLGKPHFYFHPYEFAGYAPDPEQDRYTKKTCLWGYFFMPEKKPLEPIIYETADGKKGSWMWAKLGGSSERTKELRSITPLGFAYACWQANKHLLDTKTVSVR